MKRGNSKNQHAEKKTVGSLRDSTNLSTKKSSSGKQTTTTRDDLAQCKPDFGNVYRELGFSPVATDSSGADFNSVKSWDKKQEASFYDVGPNIEEYLYSSKSDTGDEKEFFHEDQVDSMLGEQEVAGSWLKIPKEENLKNGITKPLADGEDQSIKPLSLKQLENMKLQIDTAVTERPDIDKRLQSLIGEEQISSEIDANKASLKEHYKKVAMQKELQPTIYRGFKLDCYQSLILENLKRQWISKPNKEAEQPKVLIDPKQLILPDIKRFIRQSALNIRHSDSRNLFTRIVCNCICCNKRLWIFWFLKPLTFVWTTLRYKCNNMFEGFHKLVKKYSAKNAGKEGAHFLDEFQTITFGTPTVETPTVETATVETATDDNLLWEATNALVYLNHLYYHPSSISDNNTKASRITSDYNITIEEGLMAEETDKQKVLLAVLKTSLREDTIKRANILLTRIEKKMELGRFSQSREFTESFDRIQSFSSFDENFETMLRWSEHEKTGIKNWDEFQSDWQELTGFQALKGSIFLKRLREVYQALKHKLETVDVEGIRAYLAKIEQAAYSYLEELKLKKQTSSQSSSLDQPVDFCAPPMENEISKPYEEFQDLIAESDRVYKSEPEVEVGERRGLLGKRAPDYSSVPEGWQSQKKLSVQAPVDLDEELDSIKSLFAGLNPKEVGSLAEWIIDIGLEICKFLEGGPLEKGHPI